MKHKKVTTGLIALDQHIGSLEPGQLILVGSQSSAIKTAFMIYLTNHNIVKGIAGGGFSLDISRCCFYERLLALRSSVSLPKISVGQLSKQEHKILSAQLKNLSTLPLFMDDTPGLTIEEIQKRSRLLAIELEKKGQILQFIGIDYLQLIRSQNKNISEVLACLKALAVELAVPIILTFQMKRDGNSDINLLGNGSANLICCICNEGWRGLTEEVPLTAHIIISKPVSAVVSVGFKPQSFSFYNLP